MIKSLTLTNWRSYQDVTIPFGLGTTFVVASNGIGKSSLLEALRWALFGRITRDGAGAIRVGADAAVATVELELPDGRALSVERTLLRKKGSTPPEVRIDDKPLTAEEFEQVLARAYRAEPVFLANLTVPAVGGDQGAVAKLDLAGQLGSYYGIDALGEAISRLSALLKQVQSGIKRIKVENAASARNLDDLKAATGRAARDVGLARTEHEAVRERLDRARERDRAEAALRAWDREQAAWAEAAAELTRSITRAVGFEVDVENAERVLDERLADLDRQSEAVRVEIAIATERENVLQRNDERLGGSHDDCPVCRRPLDETTITSAHQANGRDIDAARAVISHQRELGQELSARRDRLAEVLARWKLLRRPGNPPPALVDEGDTAASAELEALSDTALDVLVDARTRHAQASNDLSSAQQADEAMRRLEALFRQEATLTVALKTTAATHDELLEETVRPLAEELNQRWQGLFPARGELHTRGNGDITRTVDGHQLSFDSFSTGESMGAAIIVRLLVAQMATAADFCWFDEPLEHLDPEVRRRVANVLSRAASGEGQLRQVVVTTYEEQLAHHLHTRDAQHVHLIDVRQAN
jgi:DNA repair exonuclease SbcCD ATPase subunit